MALTDLTNPADWVSNEGVTGLNHLARSIRRYSGDDLYGMFTSYFDAAGGKDHGFTVVSGYVATLRQWDRFEADWRILLASYRLRYFHMKECSQWAGEFEDWGRDESRRASFLSSAVEIIASSVLAGVACIVDWTIYAEAGKQYMIQDGFGKPYALAGRHCVGEANRKALAHAEGSIQIDYIFEDGDEGKGDLIKLMEKDLARTPIFKPSYDRTNRKTRVLEKGVVPLQAADFAAYEIRKARVDDPLEAWFPSQYRRSLQKLAKIEHEWGQYTLEDLLAACEKQRIPRREK